MNIQDDRIWTLHYSYQSGHNGQVDTIRLYRNADDAFAAYADLTADPSNFAVWVDFAYIQ